MCDLGKVSAVAMDENNKIKRQAVFFDRDGVINFRIYKYYISKYEEFALMQDFLALFDFLKDKGCLLIVITNQQGIGKGVMTESQLAEVHNGMQEELMSKFGRQFDDILFCPDLSHTGSRRRKPEPGMLLEAAEKWNIDLGMSWMIGDRKSDMKAGKRAGCNTILVGDGDGEPIPETDHYFGDLYKVIEFFEKNGILDTKS